LVRDTLAATLVPTTSGWFAHADTHAMDIFANDPGPGARRFQGGTPPVPSLYMAQAGLDLILGFGVDVIEERVRALTRLTLDRLAEENIAVATPNDDTRRGPMVAVRARDDNALVARLIDQDIITSCRDGNVRAGFHAYNNEADIDRFIKALRESGLCLMRDAA